jgi:soluble lytic murein transglycosylase-like protein
MFMMQYNIFNVSFLQKKAKPVVTPVAIQEEPAPVAVEEEKEDIFAYQIKKAEPLYNPIILEAANLHDVDITMVKAIIMAESGYKKSSVSRYGARGLMQLMPATAKSLGVKDIFNPHENIHAGVRYYKSLLKRFNGDEKLALAAYNAGATNVRRYKGVPPFKETRRYIKKVLSYQQFYKHGPDSKESTSI